LEQPRSTGGDCGSQEVTSSNGRNYYERELSTATELEDLDAGETPYLWINLPTSDFSDGGGYSGVGGIYFYSSIL
jgi:hypothetical protein